MGDIKNDNFYQAAAKFFAHMVKGAKPITGKRTLAEIIEYVNAQGQPVDKLYIVSHANESGNLGFSLDKADLAADKSGGDHKPRLEFHELEQANQAGSLPKADTALIDAQTEVLIKGCNIGRSTLMLDELDEAFGGDASVSAPTHKQEYKYFGTKGGMVYQENFSDMFVEEPGVVDKDRAALAAEFEGKYPTVPAGNWKGLLKKVKKTGGPRVMYSWKQSNPPDDSEAAVLARAGAPASGGPSRPAG